MSLTGATMINSLLKKFLYTIQYLRFRRLLKKNEELHNCHAGQKALIFATGTSLLGLDLSKFNGNVTIGCNYIFRHPSFSSFDLKYYIAGVPFRWFRQLSTRFTHDDHHKFFRP